MEELHEAFGFFLCAVIRIREDGDVESAAGRGEAFVRLGDVEWRQPARPRPDRPLPAHAPAGLRRRRHARARLPPDARDRAASAPSWSSRCGSTASCTARSTSSSVEAGAFDEDDVRLLQTVADQVGAAMRSAVLYERLERAYLGHRGGARRRARGQGRVHGRPRPLDRRAGRGGRPAHGHGRGSSCATCGSAPSSTTSARSRCPRRSSTSPARSRPRSAP